MHHSLRGYYVLALQPMSASITSIDQNVLTVNNLPYFNLNSQF